MNERRWFQGRGKGNAIHVSRLDLEADPDK